MDNLKEKFFLKYVKDFDPFYSMLAFTTETNLLACDSVGDLVNYRVSKRKLKLLIFSFLIQIITIIRLFLMVTFPAPDFYYLIVGLHNGLRNVRPWILVTDNFLILGILFRNVYFVIFILLRF